MSSGYIEFEFDLPGALLERLVSTFGGMDAACLDLGEIQSIPEAQGVYQLFFREELVYIGKTDAESGLQKRLIRHYWNVQHRIGLKPTEVTFKAVRVYVFTAVDLESQLIRHYRHHGVVAWQESGFGANDPGRNRDHTRYKLEHFDLKYQIDIDRPLAIGFPPGTCVSLALSLLRKELPYTFRVESGPTKKQPHPELSAALIPLEIPEPTSARKMLEAAVACLPPGWQATRLPGRLLLYTEYAPYPEGEVVARS